MFNSMKIIKEKCFFNNHMLMWPLLHMWTRTKQNFCYWNT